MKFKSPELNDYFEIILVKFVTSPKVWHVDPKTSF